MAQSNITITLKVDTFLFDVWALNLFNLMLDELDHYDELIYPGTEKLKGEIQESKERYGGEAIKRILKCSGNSSGFEEGGKCF